MIRGSLQAAPGPAAPLPADRQEYSLAEAIGLWSTLREWRERRRQRRALAQLSDRLLDDIGVNRDDVASEVTKPFWQR